jgi:hypothetical protein
MLRIGPQLATWASVPWVAAVSAALLTVILCALAFGRSRKGFAAAATRFVLVAVAAGLSGSLTWAIYCGLERNALQVRAAELTARSVGSPLACLDASTGDTVQQACETAVFSSPVGVASAVTYVAAQFALLSDITDYVRRGGPAIDDVLVPLRRTLETDPFGFLAHVLVMRGCTSENCPALSLLHDPQRVRTNIIAQTLDHYVDEYRAAWARSSDAPGGGLAGSAAADGGRRKVPVSIDFPSAASIPPISIMNPEPKATPNPEAAHQGKPARDSVDPVWTPAPAQATK